MEDIIDIRFSTEATQIADTIKEKFFFSNAISVYKLAAAYALKNYSNEISLERLDFEYDKNGNNYHTASFDSDGTFKKLIMCMCPWCSTPYKYARVAAIYGLKEIKKLMDKDPDFNIVGLVTSSN